MPDILLIQPPIKDFYLTRKRTVPYGLACLAASLEQAGFSVGLFALFALAIFSLRLAMAFKFCRAPALITTVCLSSPAAATDTEKKIAPPALNEA